jgi:hypothetical protein
VAEAEADQQWRGALSVAHFASNASTFRSIKELPLARALLNHHLKHLLFPAVSAAFPNVAALEARHLRVSGASVVKYYASAGQCRLATHRDGPLVACMVALNDLGDYDGGGTFVEALTCAPQSGSLESSGGVVGGATGSGVSGSGINGGVLRRSIGHLVLHPGYVRHGGAEVTRGVRYVLVVWVFSTQLVDYSHYAAVHANRHLAHALAIPRASTSGFRQELLAAAAKGFADALALETKPDGVGDGDDSTVGDYSADDASAMLGRPRSEGALVGRAQALLELHGGGISRGSSGGRSGTNGEEAIWRVDEGLKNAKAALSEALLRAPTNEHARELYRRAYVGGA